MNKGPQEPINVEVNALSPYPSDHGPAYGHRGGATMTELAGLPGGEPAISRAESCTKQ